MPLNLIFTTSGNYTLDDDGIAGNNTSVIRDATGAVIFTFLYPADSLSFTAGAPSVNLTVNLTDTLGAANFTIGSLTSATASLESITIGNVRTTGFATLAATGTIAELGSDAGADLVASQAILSAGTGIGAPGNAIETQASFIEARTDTGGITLSNFGTVQIGGLSDDVNGLQVATSGDINFSNVGTILLGDTTGAESVRGGSTSGNVTLIANGIDADILATVDKDAITVPNGNLVLQAGQDIGFGILSNDFDNDVRASGSITVKAGRDFLIDGFADLASDDFGNSTGGNISITAGRNIHVRSVAGTDGSIFANGNAGADVVLTTGANGAVIVDPASIGGAPQPIASNSGDVIVNADRMLINSTSGIGALNGLVALGTATAGREIDLGSAGDAAFALELSDAELDRVFTPTLVVGNNATGRLTVSAAISPANASNLVLRSGGDIAVQAGITTSGSLELRAGDSLLVSSSPTITVGGSLSIFVDILGNDGGMGGFVDLSTATISATSITVNGAGDNDTLKGAESVDQIVHGNGGNDTIVSSGEGHYFGDAGNDLMLAGLSSGLVPEMLDGGAGVDTLDTRSFNGDYVINLATGVTNFSYESFVNFENIITGNGNDQIVGTAGNNVISSGAGNDVLNGGAGADLMQGGAGNDVYVIDNAGDVVDESLAGSDGTDRVQSSVLSINLSDAVHFKGAIEAAMLTGSANLNLTGNALANTLFGNDGNNVLNGATGADYMRGYGGNDIYVVDNAGDVVDESVAGSGGTDRAQSAVLSINLSDAVHFKGAIEAAMLTGSANLNLAGNSLNNILWGNDGNNVLNGLGGNDTLQGGAGNDSFVFNTALNAVSNVDRITDFSVPDDTIRLENAIFTALTATGVLAASAFHIGASAATAAQHVLYNSTNGWLSYDADGSGASAAIHFATLNAGLALPNADCVVVSARRSSSLSDAAVMATAASIAARRLASLG